MILLQQEESHGVEIAQKYEEIFQKTISLPAIHVVLKRMEKKGWVSSEFGETNCGTRWTEKKKLPCNCGRLLRR